MARHGLHGVVRTRLGVLRRVLAAVLCVAGAWAAALTICPQCAHEQPDGANFCTHCGASLREGVATQPGPAASGAAGAAVATGLTIDTNAVVAQAVAADVALARELAAQNRAEVARAVFANALAVSSIAPTALTPEQGEQILRELRQSEQRVTQATSACPACEGSGRRAVRFEGLTGEAGTLTATGQNCPTCGGSGQLRRTRSMDDLKFVLGQARQQAELALRSRGRVPVGGAWVPPELQALLDDALETRLRHAAAAPCAACQGLGRSDCRGCGNSGYVPCKAKGCEQGWVVKEDLNALGATSVIKRREPCAECAGSGRVACAACQGAGGVACKDCNGSGKRPVCTACGGVGTATCRACRGKGVQRDGTPCRDCGGDGVGLCVSCRGDGYRSR